MNDLLTFQGNGLSLRVRDTGGTGMPVVFQHGLCGDIHQPYDVFPRSDRFRLITVECRGHGESEAGDPGQFSIATFAEDILAYLKSGDIAHFVVGGISMGAAIALRIACMNPQAVTGLILARPAWGMDSAPVNMRPNTLVGMLLEEFGSARGLEIFEGSSTAKHLAEVAPDNLASLRGFFTRKPESITEELLQRISTDGPGVTKMDIARLTMPILVIGHGRDAVHPLALAKDLAALLPTARLCEITPKALSKTQYATDFTAALNDFLEGLQ